MTDEKLRQSFNEAVKSITEKLQPEYESLQKLKESPAMSTERELEILHARSKGFAASFEEQEIINQKIEAYNNKVEGIAMTLKTLSHSFGIETFVTRRFRGEYLI